jgi:hypothetical protein
MRVADRRGNIFKKPSLAMAFQRSNFPATGSGIENNATRKLLKNGKHKLDT